MTTTDNNKNDNMGQLQRGSAGARDTSSPCYWYVSFIFFYIYITSDYYQLQAIYDNSGASGYDNDKTKTQDGDERESVTTMTTVKMRETRRMTEEEDDEGDDDDRVIQSTR